MYKERQTLIKYVEDISKTIFGNSQMKISVFSEETINNQTNSTNYKYVCEIKLLEKKIEQNQIKRLSNFVKKEVNYSDTNSNKVFWIEGAKGTQKTTNRKSTSSELQTEITLPSFIDDYVYDKIGAKFAPDFSKFSRNLYHKKDDVLIYLGTYFPRSFAETYLITNNIFQNKIVENTLKRKSEINILDIGSGTGGNLSGLIFSLIKNLTNGTKFNIIAIDGNEEALKLLEKIILQIQIEYNLSISLNCHYVTFKNITDLYQKSKQFIETGFEFIISSKLINEIITDDENSYINFYINYAKHLEADGLLIMLDVTTKIEYLNYAPILLNSQTNRFIKNNFKGYKTLIPTCCAENESTCEQNCFSNIVFSVTHSKKVNDKSKVVYRVIGKYNYISSILKTIQQKGGIVGWNKNKIPNKFCPYVSSKFKSINAYKV